MHDPFSALKNALEILFASKPERKGEYAYPEIQQLKQAIENYQPDKNRTFIDLVKALRAALPRIEEWGGDFDSIKKPIDALTKTHQMASIEWDKFLSLPNVSLKFRFSALNSAQQELVPWLTDISGEEFTQLKSSKQTSLLVKYFEERGFIEKLDAQLDKDPEFLTRLILDSETNFTKIASSRLSLFLNDDQIAQAIIKYSPKWAQETQNPLTPVELVDKLNGLLSYGRSIPTLLRNRAAKKLLDDSKIFEENENENKKPLEQDPQSPSPDEDGDFKPVF